GKEYSASLYSVFTRSGASGDYYKEGNAIIRVRGIEKSISADKLKQMSKERILEGGDYQIVEFDVVSGNNVLISAVEVDPKFGYMIVFVQNPAYKNHLMLDVLYPIGERESSIAKVKSLIKSARFK